MPAGAVLALAVSALLAERDVAVAMRDGVVLRADVLRPQGAGRFPVLVYRTPYGKAAAQSDYAVFGKAVERGYAVVIQDVRGRYASEGRFEPYRNEGRDGYDTIEWAAVQAWSNGRVGSFGLSYPGAVQWLAALEAPPHLVAMVPAMTYSTPSQFFYFGGAFDLSWIAWIWNNIAPDARVRLGLGGPHSEAEARAAWTERAAELRRRLPLRAMNELREVAPYYDEWLRHPPGDLYWDWARVRGRYDRVRAAVLNLSGWHDEAYGPEGAITNFAGLLAARAGEPDPRTELVLGPWTHGVAAVGRARVGARELAPEAALDYDETVLGFLDRHLRGAGAAPPRVRAFVMGAGAWRDGESWPLPGFEPLVLQLAPGAGTRGRLAAGTGAAAGLTAFESDPANPVTDPNADAAGAQDHRWLLARPDVAVFDSEPLEADLELLGPIEARLFVSGDVPDADLWLKLLDVAPDGTAYNLWSPGSDVLRVSGTPAGSLSRATPVELRFPHLVTGNRFRKGHRLRVAVMGAFMPHFSRNLQTGARETDSAATRKGVLRIHHGPETPSRIVLPAR